LCFHTLSFLQQILSRHFHLSMYNQQNNSLLPLNFLIFVVVKQRIGLLFFETFVSPLQLNSNRLYFNKNYNNSIVILIIYTQNLQCKFDNSCIMTKRIEF